MKKSGIAEIEVHEGEESVRITSSHTGSAHQAVVQVPQVPVMIPQANVQANFQANVDSASTQNAPETPFPVVDEGHIVKSPMVGIFYASPSPDISAFVETERAFLWGRLYVRNLTEGIDRPDVHTTDTSKAVEIAIKALEGFSLVGCLEDLDTMCAQFEHKFGVKLRIPVSNRNPVAKDKQREQISEKIRKKVEEICQPDMEVYNYALSRIKEGY